ncbi:MAG: hypothetical protein RL839_12920 [Gammaproteobacteria bacterium]
MTDRFDSYEEEIGAWEVHLGKFILACGEIERATYELLLALPTEDLSSIVLNMKLVLRIDLILSLLPQRISDEGLVKQMSNLLSKVKDKIGTRNIIAHNPVELSLYDSEHGIDTRQAVSKFHTDFEKMRKTEIDIYQLIDRCTEMQLLASELIQTQYKVESFLERGK